jgi:hypothetical protein
MLHSDLKEERMFVSYFHMSSQSYEELSSKIKDWVGLEIFSQCGVFSLQYII